METLRQSTVKTRKEHDCWGCAEKFPAGTKMSVVVSKDIEKLESTYWCDICEQVLSTWDSTYLQDGIGFGELKDNDPYWKELKNLNH